MLLKQAGNFLKQSLNHIKLNNAYLSISVTLNAKVAVVSYSSRTGVTNEPTCNCVFFLNCLKFYFIDFFLFLKVLSGSGVYDGSEIHEASALKSSH